MDNGVSEIISIVANNEGISNKLISLYMIGSTDNEGQLNDIDFVAFIKKNESMLKFIEECSELLYDIILRYEVLINIFPYSIENKSVAHSMFIKNVLQDGKKIY